MHMAIARRMNALTELYTSFMFVLTHTRMCFDVMCMFLLMGSSESVRLCVRSCVYLYVYVFTLDLSNMYRTAYFPPSACESGV